MTLPRSCFVLAPLFAAACATASEEGVTGDAANGEALYTDTCAGCHLDDGTGGQDIGGTVSSDLTARVPALSDTELADRIQNGFNTAMPAQYPAEQDAADVVAYLRETFP